MVSKLAELVGKKEGFGVPGAVPTVRHNPGDLRHSPHSAHPGDPNAVGSIASDAEGWADLERQLELYAERGLTLAEMAECYAPEADGNDTAGYLAFLCAGLNLPPTTKVATALGDDRESPVERH